jgi:LuxR family maltose regulon positive regulatory protein
MLVLSQLAPPVAVSRSKIDRPMLAGQWVRRPHLEARLDRALARSLMVIAAPAGHGKTSTIATWLQLRGLDPAWVSIDDRDVDITRFATHIVLALDSVVPGVAQVLFPLLTVPDRLPPADLGAVFGECLYDLDRDVVLVLDDFHAAGDGPVPAFVTGLLQAAPRRLHTIVSSRIRVPFPLSRLRTAGDVEELSGVDLRFSPTETAELLQLETGDAVTPELATGVQVSVGGWPAAIRLIAISRRGDEEGLLRASTGRQEQLLSDYLGEEVLARLPTAQRDLLLRASLVERFNVPLLQALAADLGEVITSVDLERLRALELFREIPGLSEPWYAYHRLFRAVLKRELERTTGTEGIAALRRRLAQWFAAAGFTDEAIQQLVALDDISAAATLIESRLSETFAREDWQSVAAWLRSIPLASMLESPELLLASAWVAYLSGRDGRIGEVLANLRAPHIRHLVSAAQQAEIALLAEWPNDDPEAAVKTAEDAVALIPPHKRYRHGYAHLALAMALTTAGREDEALARLAAFTARESARVDAASIRGYFGRVVVLWQAGRLSHCEQTAADQLQLAQMNGLSLSAGWGAAFLGCVAHERGQLDEATRHFAAVFAGAEQFHFMSVRDAFCVQILIYLAQGLQSEASRAIARWRELVIATGSPHQLNVVDSFVARTDLIRGDLASAQRWLAVSTPAMGQDDLKSTEHPVLTRVKVLVAVGTEDALLEADSFLKAFMHEARASHMTLALLESLAVQGLLHEARREHEAATRVLRASLEMAAPEGIVQRYAYLGPALAPVLRRILAERVPHPHARPVLAALEAVLAAQPASARAVEPPSSHQPQTSLTDRELQVLRCLALRLTNNEIGEELFISPITVKHHVAHIADKLAVSGRRAAVARATELGLIA